MLIDDNFHFIDAGLEEEHFAGENTGARILKTNDGVKRAVHGAFNGTRHGNEIVHQGVVKHDFRESSGCSHRSLSEWESYSPSYAKFCARNGYSLFTRL